MHGGQTCSLRAAICTVLLHVGHQLDKSKGGIFTLADVHVRLSVTSSAHNLNGTLVRSSRLKKTKTHMLLTRKLYPAL